MYASHGGNLNIIHALLNHPDVDINEISDVRLIVLSKLILISIITG